MFSSILRLNVLLCMSDLIVFVVMCEVLKMGLLILEDVRIVGFDGIDEG